MVISEKIKCACGHEVANPSHPYHIKSAKHQLFLQVGDVVEGQGDNNSVTTSNTSGEPEVFIVDMPKVEVESLHPDLQTAIDVSRQPGDKIKRSQEAAKIIRSHFAGHRVTENTGQTVRGFMIEHDILIAPPSRLYPSDRARIKKEEEAVG